MNICACGNATEGKSTLCTRCGALQTLGINADATEEETKAAHHLLVKIWDPNRFQNDTESKVAAEEKIKGFNSAYFILAAAPAPSAKPTTRPTTPPAPPDAAQESQPPDTPPVVMPRSRWSSFLSLSTFLKCSIIVGAIGLGVLLLIAADSFLATNSTTARFYSSNKAEAMKVFATLKRNVMGTNDSQSAETASAPVTPEAQPTQVVPKQTSQHHERKTQSAAPTAVLPYITTGLTKEEVLTVLGTPTSSSENKLTYKGSELYFKDARVIGWKIDTGSAPLRVKIWADAPVDGSLKYFGVGSSKNEVLVIQGTPDLLTEDKFGYGASEVYFKNNRVVSWKDDPGSAPLRTEFR
jgi:hypothetical protein